MTDDVIVKREAVVQPAIYTHKENPKFETECLAHAKAYAAAYSAVYERLPEIEERVRNSGRFKSHNHEVREVERQFDLLCWWETSKAMNQQADALQHDSPPALVPDMPNKLPLPPREAIPII